MDGLFHKNGLMITQRQKGKINERRKESKLMLTISRNN